MSPLRHVVIGTCLIAAVAGCEQPVETPQTFVPPVKTEIVGVGSPLGNIKHFNGIAEGVESPTLSFRVSGTLREIQTKVGKFHQKGDVLAKLDPRDYFLSRKNLEGKVEGAEADLNLLMRGARTEDRLKIEARILSLQSTLKTAQLEYRRVQQLYANDAASKARLEKTKADMDLAEANLNALRQEYAIALKGGREEEIQAQEAQIKSIQADLDQARADVNDTVMKMPFDGVIAVKLVDNFEQIQKGQDIFIVANVEQIEVPISIPELMISQIQIGKMVEVTFLALPDSIYQAKVTKVGQVADKTTLTYPVWVELENPKREILPGMVGKVAMVFGSSSSAKPIIPIHALLQDKITKEKYVFVFDAKAGVARRKTVVLGNLIQNRMEVAKGLQNGDILITAGLDRLNDGMKVRQYQQK